ncbi:hypothetical protein FNF29_02627 [Cafeteria roenbergensis]|uniref:Chromo domain-containing protein n=1 Tax=Cafeteria roenbergensis TaxID=33653 RepID=A0A5A8CLJ7_CAFRO|nr:hypothetical protein FNF29_02627 [Cafeteria roenbergensis]|eukprot:KAA0154003.1 hypothetical protein FNF29_02627 [Cafeteria roenbergensis]
MSQFRQGETCLAFHGVCIYEAKILDSRTVDDGPTYLLHWKGWAKKWEEWVRPDRMMELTAENVELMKRVNAEAKAAESARSSAAAPGSTSKSAKSPKSGGRGSKSAGGDAKSAASGRAALAASAAQEHETLAVSVALPFALRKLLVDDWEFVTKRSCLVRIPKRAAGVAPVLPAPHSSSAAEASEDSAAVRAAKRARRSDSPASGDAAGDSGTSSSATAASPAPGAACPVPTLTVEDILHEFMRASAARGVDADVRGDEEVVEALKLYFDRSCAAFLLYRFERLQLQQYLDSRPGSDERVLCQVYGAEHMLRLFVKLPLLLSHANLSPTDAAALASRLQRVVDWLDANRERYFTSDYVRASAPYMDRFEAIKAGMLSPWGE